MTPRWVGSTGTGWPRNPERPDAAGLRPAWPIRRALGLLVLVAAGLLLGACAASEKPAAPAPISDADFRALGEVWQLRLTMASRAVDIYHRICDTPADQLQTPATLAELRDAIVRTRDLWRRAQSYGIPAWPPVRPEQPWDLRERGLNLVLGARGLYSSRGRMILDTDQQWVEPFRSIIQGDPGDLKDVSWLIHSIAPR